LIWLATKKYHLQFRIATRGLLGVRNLMLTATRGNGVMNTIFLEYAPMAGEIQNRDAGSLVAFETGQVTAYALMSAQQRGLMFCKPGDQVSASSSYT
jgi:GTP-binding protein